MSTTRNKSMQSGQGLVEYALILTLVAVVVIGILTMLGPQVGNVFCNVTNTVNGSPVANCTHPSNNAQNANCGNNGNGNGNGSCNGNGNNGNGG